LVAHHPLQPVPQHANNRLPLESRAVPKAIRGRLGDPPWWSTPNRKILYRQEEGYRGGRGEPVADDLASLALDLLNSPGPCYHRCKR